jgi:hypothetical protein
MIFASLGNSSRQCTDVYSSLMKLHFLPCQSTEDHFEVTV